MNCEQKSGVFLNEDCKRTAANTCSNCEKHVCKVHTHRYDAIDLCEDCYWEKFLYAEQARDNDYVHDDTRTHTNTNTHSTTESTNEGFDGGFGGGGFGGGGASGAWTEGEAQSFNETDNGGGLFDNDDTFYYS